MFVPPRQKEQQRGEWGLDPLHMRGGEGPQSSRLYHLSDTRRLTCRVFEEHERTMDKKTEEDNGWNTDRASSYIESINAEVVEIWFFFEAFVEDLGRWKYWSKLLCAVSCLTRHSGYILKEILDDSDLSDVLNIDLCLAWLTPGIFQGLDWSECI